MPETSGAHLAPHLGRQQRAQLRGVALDHLGLRHFAAQEGAEVGVDLDDEEALGRDSRLEQRLGDGPGAGADLDDVLARTDLDVLGDQASQPVGGGEHGAHLQRMREPAAQEQQFLAGRLAARGRTLGLDHRIRFSSLRVTLLLLPGRCAGKPSRPAWPLFRQGVSDTGPAGAVPCP
jgi:hypothetical protein